MIGNKGNFFTHISKETNCLSSLSMLAPAIFHILIFKLTEGVNNVYFKYGNNNKKNFCLLGGCLNLLTALKK